MARQRKFRAGRRIENFADFASCVTGGRWLYWNDRPKHPGWLCGLQFRTIDYAIRGGLLRVAELNEHHEENAA